MKALDAVQEIMNTALLSSWPDCFTKIERGVIVVYHPSQESPVILVGICGDLILMKEPRFSNEARFKLGDPELQEKMIDKLLTPTTWE